MNNETNPTPSVVEVNGRMIRSSEINTANAKAAEVGAELPYQMQTEAPAEQAQQQQEIPMTEASSTDELRIPAPQEEPALAATDTEEPVADASVEQETDIESESDEIQVDETTEENSSDSEESDPDNDLIELANAFSEIGYTDEQIDAWIEHPEQEHINPDMTERVVINDGKLTENQWDLLTGEFLLNGAISPANIESLSAGLNMPKEVIQDYIDSKKNALQTAAREVAANDMKTTGWSPEEYSAIQQMVGQMPADQRAAVEAQLNSPARAITLFGLEAQYRQIHGL